VARSRSTSRELKGLKTLIVEDYAPFREMLQEGLQKLFSSMLIEQAAEGSEALQKVDTFLPNLIFMDIKLPGENGLQLTRKIKAKYPDMNVTILTDCDSMEYQEAAFRYGADHFICKGSSNWAEIETLVQSFISEIEEENNPLHPE
jgi:DNA-binding NarL/FixJ family response regulator